MKNLAFFFFLLSHLFNAHAQGVAINASGNPADASAILDISSTSKGVLIPRMTLTERDMIADPASGLLIYQTDSIAGIYIYTGYIWSNLTQDNYVWGVSGNSGTNPATHFIGTTDTQPLRFRVNNVWAGELGNENENSYIGLNAGLSNTTGNFNSGFGTDALFSNTTGYQNTAVGREAMKNNATGYENSCLGNGALYANTTGNQNTAIGTLSLFSNTVGYKNTAIGRGALWSNTTGNSNMAVGTNSLFNNTEGIRNTACGVDALFSNITGDQNTANGWIALNSNNSGSFNTANGSGSLRYNTMGSFNTATGANSLKGNLYGHDNTANGYNALQGNATGFGNTAIGSKAMEFNLDGYLNVAIGNNTLALNSSGNANTAIGSNSMPENSTASANTAIGSGAMLHNTVGYSNTSIGQLSMNNNTVGIQNTAVGVSALENNTTGYNNSALGYFSGTGGGSWNNTISVGNAGYLNGYHNQAFIGNLSTAWIGGNTTWYTYSDARVKTNVREDVKGLDFIIKLRPVTYLRDIDSQAALTGNTPTEDFEGKYDIKDIKFSGFLAQEVEQAAQASGYDFSGVTTPRYEKELYTLSYEVFVVPLVKAVQEQQAIIEEQNEKIDTLQLRLSAVELVLQKLKNK